MLKIEFEKENVGNIKDNILKKVVNENHPINNISYNLRKCSSHDWDLPYSSSWYGISGSNTDEFAIEQAVINVDDWLDIQASARNMSKSQFLKGANEDTKKRVEKDIRNNDTSEIPAPVLEVKPNKWPSELNDGDTVIYEPMQEGRSRGLGAKNAGVEWLPIWVAVRRIRK